jgi:RNA polymerase sigma factor (sigma-70 family)
LTGIELAGREGCRDSDGRDDEIALAARSNPTAFELLYRRHRQPVFRYLRARTGSDEDALELTAVVFERALTAVGRYRPSGGGVVAWLFRIARNAANDAARSRRRRTWIPLEDLQDEGEPRDPEAAEDGFLKRERLAELRARVAGLPELQREAIVLRYAGGLTAREIGVTLGKSEAAAQKILSRALATLREAYRDDE